MASIEQQLSDITTMVNSILEAITTSINIQTSFVSKFKTLEQKVDELAHQDGATALTPMMTSQADQLEGITNTLNKLSVESSVNGDAIQKSIALVESVKQAGGIDDVTLQSLTKLVEGLMVMQDKQVAMSEAIATQTDAITDFSLNQVKLLEQQQLLTSRLLVVETLLKHEEGIDSFTSVTTDNTSVNDLAAAIAEMKAEVEA